MLEQISQLIGIIKGRLGIVKHLQGYRQSNSGYFVRLGKQTTAFHCAYNNTDCSRAKYITHSSIELKG
ncbi:hypothetical protein XELAEV_18045278mg [Xenopus laevis]|uniref:Uncharacterized protein n=1 Tax=Xenopus laevis TaxID=8355 RepID=A0A974C0A3_XENLA|nr:hypothetical protein XELAEV_18045278mg [Xenopus laevis]